MDRRDALPRAPPARAPRPRRSAMGGRDERASPQILPDHPPGPLAARGGAPAVASGGRRAPGRLAGTGPARPGRATATGCLTMPTPGHGIALEEQIDQWRSYLRRRQAIHSVDIAELEDHLREQIAALRDAGLAADEAFLVAVKRIGNLDALSREFAVEHSDRLWKQLVAPADSGDA